MEHLWREIKISVMAMRPSNLKDLELITKDKSPNYKWMHSKSWQAIRRTVWFVLTPKHMFLFIIEKSIKNNLTWHISLMKHNLFFFRRYANFKILDCFERCFICMNNFKYKSAVGLIRPLTLYCVLIPHRLCCHFLNQDFTGFVLDFI